MEMRHRINFNKPFISVLNGFDVSLADHFIVFGINKNIKSLSTKHGNYTPRILDSYPPIPKKNENRFSNIVIF